MPLHKLDEAGNVEVIEGEKAYYINIIMQMKFEDHTENKRYRVVFNRLGITEIEELK